ncbi:MAG: hypothetical protein JO360_17315 [Acidobacteria bacterium]|nr:hypothetical protein [Acidobacteriota bacterium]
MNASLVNRIRLASSFSALLILFVCLSTGAHAQDQLLVPNPSAPPPMKFISSTDRTQLSTTHDAKGRLKMCIEMAETRLLRAEQLTVDQRFINATSELGIYQAIIEDALSYLGQQKVNSDKTRDLYKRLEIQLRADATRIEAIRRVTPSDYAVHVKAIRDFADNARTNALNAFFSDTVLPQGKERSAGQDKSTANAAAPGQAPPKSQ